MNTKNLMGEVAILPIEERILIVDFLLRSLNQPESDIDKEWAVVAQRRLMEMRTGKIESVPGEAVFKKIWDKFNK
jgi:putative addiction module component (TIGR02574 family)